ncbi:MAG: hypothetical protein ACR2HF_12220 [Methylococcaceae bacterium]
MAQPAYVAQASRHATIQRKSAISIGLQRLVRYSLNRAVSGGNRYQAAGPTD